MFLGPVPPELLIVRDWIITLSPVWGAALIIFWKPLKTFGNRVYNKYVKEPDAKQDGRLDKIEVSIRRVENRQDLSHDAYLALLHDRIYQCCKRYLERGCVTDHELKNLEYLFEPYEKSGGNGTAKKMYMDCQNLPLQTEKQEKNK